MKAHTDSSRASFLARSLMTLSQLQVYTIRNISIQYASPLSPGPTHHATTNHNTLNFFDGLRLCNTSKNGSQS